MLAIAEHHVLGVAVGYDGVEHGSNAVSRYDCAEESHDKVETLHVALEYLQQNVGETAGLWALEDARELEEHG